MKPSHDPTQLLDDLRASALSQLLVAGCTEFDFGAVLDAGPIEYGELCTKLGLADRPATVLCTAMRSLDLIAVSGTQVSLTNHGREKLTPDSPFNLRGYIGLGAYSADVQNMIACLKNDTPAGDISFVFHEDAGPSALDDPDTSDALTRAMAARARNVAPFAAEKIDVSNGHHVLDVGGAHGIYSFELLKRFANLKATIVDREPPLKVAKEFAENHGVESRVELEFGDIHKYQISSDTDVVLMANILHDYDSQVATRLVDDYANQLPAGGKLIILDAFLESTPPEWAPISAGPRPIAAYSAMLFSICEGRCYRRDEYESMMRSAGLTPAPDLLSIPAHGSILIGTK